MSLSARQYTPEEEAEMRARGLKPITIWVPDLSDPAIAAEYRRQAELSANLHGVNDIESFSEAALADLDLPPYEDR